MLQLDVELKEDIKSGFKITMRFEPNPYFEEAELYKVRVCAGCACGLPSCDLIPWLGKDGVGGRGWGAQVVSKARRAPHGASTSLPWLPVPRRTWVRVKG